MKNGLLIFLLALGFLAGCTNASSDDQKIADAQSCLNSATSTNVNQCLASIQNLTTPAAYLIRCAAAFVQEGLGTARLSSVITQLKNQTSTTTDGATIFSVLAFRNDSSATNNMNDITNASTSCSLSGSSGFILLAKSSFIATTALFIASPALLAPGATIDTTAIQSSITSVQDNSTVQQQVGTAALSAYQSSCVNSTASGAQGICSQFQAALAASGNSNSPAAVGCQLLKSYSAPATATPCPN